MTQTTANIDLSFEHTTPDGDSAETTINVEFTYTPGCPAVMYQRNGDPGWPAEPSEVEFQRAFRRVDGKWIELIRGEWLEDWAIAALAAADPDRVANCIPSGPDPDDARDAAFDREMNR